MESHPYTKPRGVGPVTTQLTPGAEPASSKSAGPPGPWSCSPTCGAWSESSTPSLQIQRARVRAVLAARAIRVRALLGARAIIVGPHPPPFYTSSLTSHASRYGTAGPATMLKSVMHGVRTAYFGLRAQ